MSYAAFLASSAASVLALVTAASASGYLNSIISWEVETFQQKLEKIVSIGTKQSRERNKE
jgi:hypothetical protein